MKNKMNLSLSLRKLILSAMVAAPLATLPAPLWAVPDVTTANLAKPATTLVNSLGTTVTITDNTTNRLVLKWNEFGGGGSPINVVDTVQWTLAGPTAAVLNLVNSAATVVNGTLSSNGQVLIVNPNGITIGATGVVNTAGLTLSTIQEAEFTFQSTGALGYSGTATTGVTIQSGASINVGSSGNVFLAGNAASVAGNINGALLSVTTQNGPVTLGAGGVLNVGTLGVDNAAPAVDTPGYGNVTVSSGTGAVNLAASPVAIRGTNLTVNTNGGVVTAPAALVVGDTLSEANININTAGGGATPGAVTLTAASGANNVRLNMTLNSGAANITQTGSTGDLRFQASTVAGNLTVAGGTGSITRGGDIAMTGATRNIALSTTGVSKSITMATSGGDINYGPVSVGGNTSNGSVTLISRDGSIQLPTMQTASLTVTAANNITQVGAGLNSVVVGTPVLGVNALPNGNGQVNSISGLGTQLWTALPTYTVDNTGTGGSGGSYTLALNTDDPATAARLSTTRVGGSGYTSAPVPSALTGGTVAAGGSSATYTFDSTNGSINLTNAANNFGVVVLKNAPGGVDIVDALHNLNIGNGTNVNGSAQLRANGGDIVFGGYGSASSTAVQTASFGSTLAIPAAANVSDKINNLTIEGASTIAATTNVELNGAFDNGVALSHRLGQMNVTAGGVVALYESTTLNLGTISAGSLRAYSVAGDVIQTGALTTAGAVLVGAGNAFAPGNVTLNFATNSITGPVSILDDITLLTNTPVAGATVGSLLARNVTLVNNASLLLGSMNSTANTGIAGNLDVTVTSGANSISQSAATDEFTVAGTVTLNAPGAITMDDEHNRISNVTVTSGAATSIRSQLPLTANATLSGTANSTFRSGDTVRIGSVKSSSTGSVTFNSGSETTSALADTVAGIFIYGPAIFTSSGSVNVSRAGHSFGRVQVSTGNNRSATIVESGTLRLGQVTTNGTGSFTATSTTGDIIQDTATNGVRLGNGASGTATFSAPMGNVILDDSTGGLVNVNSMARVNITAGGNVVLNNPGTVAAGGNPVATALGNITAGGTFSVNSGTNPISQLSSSRLNVYGTTSFTATEAALAPNSDITIGNTGNRMGGIVVSATAGNVTLTEGPTMNLKSITTNGNLTATSESGSIIDSGDTAIALNRVSVPAGNTSFTANNGNVTLGLGNSNYNVVSFSTAGNATILDSALNLTLGTSTIGGTLDIITTAAAQTLNQSGPLSIGGNVSITTNNGTIDLSNTANQLGGIRFTAGQVSIAEATSLNLRAGSVATGAVQLSTGGDFVTSGAGASSFTNNLTISAPNGTIIPGAGSLLVVGNLTVFSNVAKDLSQLSKSGSLTNKDPINLGSGTYTPPGQ